MGRTATLNREQPSATFYGMAVEKKQPPSLEELGREVEVLRGKLQSLRMAQDRVERDVQRLTELFQSAQTKVKLKTGTA